MHFKHTGRITLNQDVSQYDLLKDLETNFDNVHVLDLAALSQEKHYTNLSQNENLIFDKRLTKFIQKCK